MDRKFIECKIENFSATVMQTMSERERLREEAAGWGCFIAKQKTGKEVEE